MITKRTTVPSKDDKRYIQVKYGGDYLGMLGNPSYFKGSALGNCVAYAFGRRQEIEKELTGNEHTIVGIPKGRTIYKPTSAYLWYGIGTSVDGYERSRNVAKVGAVAVWKNNAKLSGHVAIIEEIGKNYLGFSESGMGLGGYVWRYVKAYPTYCLITNYDWKKNKYVTSKHWNYKYKNGVLIKANNTFLGYIYPPKQTKQMFELGNMVKVKGLTRTILEIDNNKEKPYKVGIPSTASTTERVTGWYAENELTRV